MTRIHLAALALTALVAGIAGSAGGSQASPPPDLFDEIHARGRLLEAKMQTVRARFTETTVSSLLARPAVAKGTLLAARPPRVLLQYTSPEPKTLLMDGRRLVVTWPDGREPETVDISGTMKRVNQYFTNADVKALRKIFVVQALPATEIPNTYRLDMVPKRKQVKEGLERLQIWLDRDTLFFAQMKMSFPGGDSNTFRIEDAELNVPLGPRTFEIEAPAGRKD
jgi:outer membrane lipoprotein-sorting protein